MKTHDAIKEVERKTGKAKKHFDDVQQNFLNDDIHDFRVEIKKLRSYFRLLNCGVKAHEQLTIDKKVKSFYHAIGDMRNIQLHKKRIDEFCNKFSIDTPQLYLQLLDIELAKQKEDALDAAKKISWKHFRNEAASILQDKMDKDFAHHFLFQKQEQLRFYLTLTHFYDEDLHESRKILKDILYNYDYFSSEVHVLVFPKEHIEILADKLGDFQDFRISVGLMDDSFVKFIINHREREQLALLKGELQREKDHLKENAVNLLWQSANVLQKRDILNEVYSV